MAARLHLVERDPAMAARYYRELLMKQDLEMKGGPLRGAPSQYGPSCPVCVAMYLYSVLLSMRNLDEENDAEAAASYLKKARDTDLTRRAANETRTILRVASTYKYVQANRDLISYRKALADNESTWTSLRDELASKVADCAAVEGRLSTSVVELADLAAKKESQRNEITMHASLKLNSNQFEAELKETTKKVKTNKFHSIKIHAETH